MPSATRDKLELMYARTTSGSAAQKLKLWLWLWLTVSRILLKPKQSCVGSNQEGVSLLRQLPRSLQDSVDEARDEFALAAEVIKK